MHIGTKAIKLTNLAEDLLKKGVDGEAMEALKRSMRLSNGNDMKSYLQIALSLFESGDYEHAKIFLNTFLEYWMASEAYFILGDIAKKEKRLKDAFELYRKGLSLYNSHNLNPYYEFLSLCSVLQEEDEGLEIAKYLLKRNNRDRVALVYMANYFYRNKLYREAISFYKILVESDLADYNDYHYYGICLHEIKDYKKAEDMYIQALSIYPANTPAAIELKNLRNKNLKDNYPNLEKSRAKYTK
ncbi:tetratricopeptide repeat protein, partial [Brachyspira catarrhinii]